MDAKLASIESITRFKAYNFGRDEFGSSIIDMISYEWFSNVPYHLRNNWQLPTTTALVLQQYFGGVKLYDQSIGWALTKD